MFENKINPIVYYLTWRGAIPLLVGDPIPRDIECDVDVGLVRADVVVLVDPGHGAAGSLEHVSRHRGVHAVIVATGCAAQTAIRPFLGKKRP